MFLISDIKHVFKVFFYNSHIDVFTARPMLVTSRSATH